MAKPIAYRNILNINFKANGQSAFEKENIR